MTSWFEKAFNNTSKKTAGCQSLVDSTHEGPVMGGFDVSFVTNPSNLFMKQSSSLWFEIACRSSEVSAM